VSESLVAVVGADATIVNDAVRATITELLDGIDPSLALDDLTVRESGGTDDDTTSVIQRVLEALNTPPFLVDRRVVVLRDAQVLRDDDADLILAWAGAPTPGITLLVAHVGTKAKGKLAKAADRVVDVAVGSRPKDRLSFVAERLESHGVKCSPAVTNKIAERLGDDMARMDSLARTLQSIYGTAPLTFEHVEPYLGDAGAVPEWDLTDAVDQGQAPLAIEVVRRMITSKSRSGLQIINILQRHYLKMARLDGSGASSGEEAAAIIGGHAFPAQKLVRSARLLGGDRIAYAVGLITSADRDLKGGTTFGGRNDEDVDQTDLTVTEVLVARLAKMSEAARRS
jgi:DNA polymerase III subunit delta